jgi:hypothetical protein
MLRGDRSREVTALAGITCALGLVYLWRKLNVLTRRVVSLADRVKQHETDIEWLTQRLESARSVPASASVPLANQTPPRTLHEANPLVRTPSWESMVSDTAGYRTAEEFDVDEPSGRDVPTGSVGADDSFGAGPSESVDSSAAALLEEVDARYERKELADAYALVEGRSGDAATLWRRARLSKELADQDKASGDKAGEREWLLRGLADATTAMETDGECFQSHKWYAILVGLTSSFEGTKATIQKSFVVKEHFLRAAELNPGDATAKHLLGVWCFEVAGLSWAMRKVAAAAFSEPPTATFDEAHEHFAAAERIEPGFYPRNRLLLGKTSLKLKDRDAARRWLEQALERPCENQDDSLAQAEARQLLGGL